MDKDDTDDANNGYDFQTTVPIKIKKRKKPPGIDKPTPHHTNKIGKACIPEDMNNNTSDVNATFRTSKTTKSQTENTKVIDAGDHNERSNRKRKRRRNDSIVVCVHCINRNLHRSPIMYNDEYIHVAKSARIDQTDTRIPRRSDSLLSDNSCDEEDPTDNDDEHLESNKVMEEATGNGKFCPSPPLFIWPKQPSSDNTNNTSISKPQNKSTLARHVLPDIPLNSAVDTEINTKIAVLFKAMKLDNLIRPNDAEVQKIISSLKDLDLEDIEIIYANVRKRLKGMNGYVVQYSKILTALLGCNTNSILLGSTEQSKGATFYIGPYIDKNKNPLIESLDIVLKAMDLARKYPSVADDSDTPRRITQLIMTKILNQLNNLMEVSDTQAAAGLLGISAGMCSDKFVVYDANCHNNFVSDECKVDLTTYNTESGTDDDTYIYSSMDDSSLNDNSYSDSEDSNMVPSEVEIDDNMSHSDCDCLPDVAFHVLFFQA